ncbi:MAG: HNH endonuclease signature motif containing protein [Acidimicrobiales bacterium]
MAGETCEIAGVGPIPVEAVRQILRDDAFLAVVVRRGRDVVNVAHHGRGLNAHQRTALEAGELRCTNASCNRTVAMEVDHRVPWAVDPVTELHNQDLVCSGCHRLKTHHGHAFEPGTGRRRLLPPDDPDHPGHLADRGPLAGRGRGGPSPMTDAEVEALEAKIAADLARKGRPVPERLAGRGGRSARPDQRQPSRC